MSPNKPSLLPDNYLEIAANLVGEGYTHTEVLHIMQTQYGLTDLTHRALQQRLLRHKKQRAELTRQVIAEKIGQQITNDMERLQKYSDDVLIKAEQHKNDENPSMYLKALAEARKLLMLKFSLTGGANNGSDDGDGERAQQDMLDKIRKLKSKQSLPE